MRAAATLSLTGLLGVILLELAKIVMEPVVAWMIGVLLLGLKIGLGLIAVGVTIFVVRRVMRAREEAEA
jgi:hypothetical protein